MPAENNQRLVYRDKFRSLHNDAFQSWFECLARAIHGPGAFQPIRKTSGDGGLDGFVINEHLVYQVYAPARIKELRDAETAAKIKADFLTAFTTLGGELKAWIFLHNHPEAKIGKLTTTAISTLKKAHPTTDIRILDIDSLWEMLKCLPDGQLEDLFGKAIGRVVLDLTSGETDKRRAAERRWQYIQNHPIRGVEILFILKEAVGFNWFRDVLEDTQLTFSPGDHPFKLGKLFAASPAPNTTERSRMPDKPVCSFWELYEPEPGYWFKKIAPTSREFSVVAGFDAVAPWSMLSLQHVAKLEDLALMTDIGVSIPARAYQIGVEEFVFSFVGDTFSFSVQLSEHVLEALHEFARTQHAIADSDKMMPLGTSFSGVQLLDMFLKQSLPRAENEESKHGIGMMGLSGPDGKAISFYPTMPIGFNKASESNEYTFTITVPSKIDSPAHIKRLEKKLQSHPADAELYAELAALYSHEGRLQDVMRCLRIAIKKAAPNVGVHVMMGESLAKVGRFDEAFTHFEKAAALPPAKDGRVSSSAQTGLGICLHELGKDAAALAHFQAAARMEPLKAACQSNLGMALMKLGRYFEATPFYKRARELAPDDSKIATYLGILFQMEGRTTEAISLFEAAAKLSPTSADAHEILGQHLGKTNQHEKAVASLQRAIEIEPTVQRYDLLGASLAGLDRWPEAETAFRRGVELNPNHSGILANLGATVANLGRYAEAAELLEKSLRADPNNANAKNILTQLRSQRRV